MFMKIQNNFSPIEQMVGQIATTKSSYLDKKQCLTSEETVSFEEVLEKTSLKFSKHANQRLESRKIDLSQNQLHRLQNGTQMAREKGIKESLVMIDDLAFIVNVKNNTVVTAVNDTTDGVFTNIDGAVIN